MLQSLNRAIVASDERAARWPTCDRQLQSLNRAIVASDFIAFCAPAVMLAVTIPQSGYRRFRLWALAYYAAMTIHGYNPSIGLSSLPTTEDAFIGNKDAPVTIPQSGYRRFRPRIWKQGRALGVGLQSLNRAIVASDVEALTSLLLYKYGYNPSIGLSSLPTLGSSDVQLRAVQCYNPSIGLSSLPTLD